MCSSPGAVTSSVCGVLGLGNMMSGSGPLTYSSRPVFPEVLPSQSSELLIQWLGFY